MLISPNPPKNAFLEAYNALNDHDKERMRDLICLITGKSKNCFYVWLYEPEKMRKLDRYAVALLFDKEPSELFKPLNPQQ